MSETLESREPHGRGVISDLIYQNFGSFHCFLPLFLGSILNWLLQCFCRLFFKTSLVIIITVVVPPHPADTARLARHPRLAVLFLTPLGVNRRMLLLLTPLLLFSSFILYSLE